jgi:hypothetical protein
LQASFAGIRRLLKGMQTPVWVDEYAQDGLACYWIKEQHENIFIFFAVLSSVWWYNV